MITLALKNKFINLASPFCNDSILLTKVWNDIELAYSNSSRYYHTLEHLDSMFKIISTYETKLNTKNADWFAVWFHDIVYDSARTDNEEQSAIYAKIFLAKINVSIPLIEEVVKLILLTKNHIANELTYDEKLFLDSDLAILGSSPEEYLKYQKLIRQEYQQYSDVIYNAGRKKVLQHFLNQTQIYKTEELYNLLETNARNNIQSELKQLST